MEDQLRGGGGQSEFKSRRGKRRLERIMCDFRSINNQREPQEPKNERI